MSEWIVPAVLAVLVSGLTTGLIAYRLAARQGVRAAVEHAPELGLIGASLVVALLLVQAIWRLVGDQAFIALLLALNVAVVIWVVGRPRTQARRTAGEAGLPSFRSLAIVYVGLVVGLAALAALVGRSVG